MINIVLFNYGHSFNVLMNFKHSCNFNELSDWFNYGQL